MLGAGSESTVYAMDGEHVLRIYRESVPWEYVEARRAFYEALGREQLPFAVPLIYTVGSWVGHVYTVEQRIQGQDFGKVLPDLQGSARSQALSNYQDAAALLGSVHFPDRPYGELIATAPIQHESWQGYLLARMEQTLAQSRADLEADVPDFGQMLELIYNQLPNLGDEPVKSLVHGDYWPSNVLITDDLEISGVVDFSYATVVGDARMDIAGATFFLETSFPYSPDDVLFLRQQVGQRWGEEMLAVVDFYRLYYSIFFSGCKVDDPTTYAWCVKNLREYSTSSDVASRDVASRDVL
jgi:aminoglycoside phosphotransferase (APT) family kinase protein